MSEEQPPIVHGQNPAWEDGDNPYRPSSALAVEEPASPDAGLAILLSVMLAIVISVAAAFFGLWGVTIPLLTASILGAIRAKLLQRRFTMQHPGVAFTAPYARFIVSCCVTFVIGLAASIAFLAICLPGGFLAFGTNSAAVGLIMFALFAGSGGVGLAVFAGLFWLSLKLPF